MDKETKLIRYDRIRTQLNELLDKTTDPPAQMATIAALLYHKFDYYFWCGFYRLLDDDLVVGPYQGPLACQVLAKNKGVCWEAVKSGKTVIVPDIRKFPNHIACDQRVLSEIVVPVRDKNGVIVAVLDVDSDKPAQFDESDAAGLQGIVELLKR
ncbi:MAG: GAF domain-containing protein [Candidatus Aminicenantes bacterium]|nr:GAF domain-containing protein [Candidatus Aminicenantes bacterium]